MRTIAAGILVLMALSTCCADTVATFGSVDTLKGNSLQGLQISGSVNVSGGYLQFPFPTMALNQVASLWTTRKFTKDNVFRFSARFVVTACGGGGCADGITFALQKNGPRHLGTTGSGLGICDDPSKSAFFGAVDIWRSRLESGHCTSASYRNVNTISTSPFPFSFAQNVEYTATAILAPTSSPQVRLTFCDSSNCAFYNTSSVNVSNYLSSDMVWAGITLATGGSQMLMSLRSFSLDVSPPTPVPTPVSTVAVVHLNPTPAPGTALFAASTAQEVQVEQSTVATVGVSSVATTGASSATMVLGSNSLVVSGMMSLAMTAVDIVQYTSFLTATRLSLPQNMRKAGQLFSSINFFVPYQDNPAITVNQTSFPSSSDSSGALRFRKGYQSKAMEGGGGGSEYSETVNSLKADVMLIFSSSSLLGMIFLTVLVCTLLFFVLMVLGRIKVASPWSSYINMICDSVLQVLGLAYPGLCFVIFLCFAVQGLSFDLFAVAVTLFVLYPFGFPVITSYYIWKIIRDPNSTRFKNVLTALCSPQYKLEKSWFFTVLSLEKIGITFVTAFVQTPVVQLSLLFGINLIAVPIMLWVRPHAHVLFFYSDLVGCLVKVFVTAISFCFLPSLNLTDDAKEVIGAVILTLECIGMLFIALPIPLFLLMNFIQKRRNAKNSNEKTPPSISFLEKFCTELTSFFVSPPPPPPRKMDFSELFATGKQFADTPNNLLVLKTSNMLGAAAQVHGLLGIPQGKPGLLTPPSVLFNSSTIRPREMTATLPPPPKLPIPLTEAKLGLQAKLMNLGLAGDPQTQRPPFDATQEPPQHGLVASQAGATARPLLVQPSLMVAAKQGLETKLQSGAQQANDQGMVSPPKLLPPMLVEARHGLQSRMAGPSLLPTPGPLPTPSLSAPKLPPLMVDAKSGLHALVFSPGLKPPSQIQSNSLL